MGILDAPSYSRPQADARFNRKSAYSTDLYDRARGLTLPALYNYGDITLALSTGSSSITNPVLIAGNDPSIRFSGGRLDAPITVTGATTYYTGGNPTGSALDSSPGFYADWELDSAQYEIKFYTNAANRAYKLWIDNKPFTVGVNALATASTVYRLLVTLSGRRSHHCRLLTSAGFIGLSINKTDSIWRPNVALWKKRVYFLGDSYTVGANATYGIDAYPYYMAEMLGWEPVVGGEASTGYTTVGTGGNGRDTFLNRVVNDVVPQQPDTVFIWGGQNDTINGNNLADAVSATLSALKTGLPNAPVYLASTQWPSGDANATRDQKDSIILAAGAAAPNVKASWSSKGWITGNGNAGSPNGSGNADTYISGDGLHPNSPGHQMFGYRHGMQCASVTA